MKRSEQFRTLGVLAVCTLFLFGWVIAVAEEAEPNAAAQGQLEVRTTLEQRMQKKISVDFRDTPIEDVVRIMAEQADVDVVKSPKVTGNVTAKLTNVPLEEALRNILQAHGYDFVASRNMIRVAPSTEITQEAEKLISKIYRITYADIKEVEKALTRFISQRGSISSNPGTSNIIVTDAESKIKAIDTFVEEIDRITPQILVEARIYDITSKDKLDLGIEWNAGTQTTYYEDEEAVVPPGVMGNIKTDQADPFATGMFRGATGKTASTTGLLKFGWFTGSVDIDAIIRAQQNLINAKLLANPRILVLDNEKANIKIISEIPYQELSQTSGGGSIGSTSFKDVGVELEVTPHLTRDEMIRLRLKPKFSVKTDDVVYVGTGIGVQFPVPVVDRREADTILLVQDGQTVVLGGLRKKDIAKQVNKVPLLGDIPVICYLFRFEGESNINSELVVFVTPRIVKEAVLSSIEKKQYEVTEFLGPEPDWTRAEKDAAEGK